MKRFLSVCLAFLMICTMLPMSAVSAFAEEIDEKEAKYIDPEIYFAQCMAGVATDKKSDAATRCNNLYNYYINENIYSPTQSFLDSCYENKSLMKEYDIWKSSSLAADPSSALKMVMKKEDYYQSLIIAMYTKATAESNAFQEVLKNKAINQSKSIISSLCEIKKITEVSQIVDAVDITDPETVIALEKCVSATYSLATVKKVNGVIGDILSYGKDILDVVDRLAVYGTMVELDEATKLWINQMYNSCTSDTDVQLKSALKTLSLASTDFAGAALADVKKTAFVLTNWVVKETVNVGMAGLTVGNPLLAAVFAGLKLGKTVCNIFFETDDVCEQLFTMECIYDVQDLSRRVAESRKNAFISEQSVENAKSYIYAVDCYYESIIKIDIDCMEKFLDKLYNGGILSGLIKWAWGATDDYQECIDALEGLRSARLNNYNNMHTYFKIALQLNYPDTYSLYFTPQDTVKVTGIYFPTTRIFPTEYPANYANLLVGEFFNINVMYTPRNTTQKGFVAVSDNPDVVRIEGNAMVGVSEGTANVTVTSTADPFVFYTAEIVVKNRLEDVEIGAERNYFKYTVENGEAIITGLVDGYYPTVLNIPSKISDYTVTKIGNRAFYGNEIIKIVNIPDSVINIGTYSFGNCIGINELSIPASIHVESYDCSFYGCNNISKLIISKGTGKMEDYGDPYFSGTSTIYSPWRLSRSNLKEVIIKDGVKNIGSYAFMNCYNLVTITIPSSIEIIGKHAFVNTTSNFMNLNINYTGTINQWVQIDFVDYGSNPAYNSSKLYINNEPIDNIELNNISKVNDYAFYGYQGLSSVFLGESIIEIGDSAFNDCKNLTDVTIGQNVTNIGNNSFYNCALTNLIISDSVTTIGNWAFGGCTSLASVTISNSVTDIGFAAFYGCASLKSVTIPDSVASIDSYAFEHCAFPFTIYGKKGSVAETYAVDNAFIFIPFTEVKDNKTDITIIETKPGVIPENTELKIENIENTATRTTYDISLVKNGTTVQPDGKVTVKIPVPENMNGRDCTVYRQEADGTYTDMNAVYQDGYMVFTTDHFSIYVLTVTDPNIPALTAGDVNGDGKINAVDARWILQAASGARTLSAEQNTAADVNGDGKINAVDARWILQVASGSRVL